MSNEVPYLKCPICGNNFHQSFECDHDEYDLIEFYRKSITKLQALLKPARCPNVIAHPMPHAKYRCKWCKEKVVALKQE